MHTWKYTQPVEIIFKADVLNDLDDILSQRGFSQGILICSNFFVKNGMAKEVMNSCASLRAVHSGIQPNPTLENVQSCAAAMVAAKAEFALAIGGGSVLDCAKIACAIAKSGQQIAKIYAGEEKLSGDTLPMIAVPTTAGTGSEVTAVSVLNDDTGKLKASVVDPCLFPKLAIIDPVLTMSMPPAVTAATGLDALAHALEGFWSKNHQPICDALALEAARKVFSALPVAYKSGNDIKARTEMCEASLIAGLAFALPRTAGSHACSYILTTDYGMSHGEACAFTLAAFTRINADAEKGRLHDFAKKLGFEDALAMADRIDEMKKEMGLKYTLGQAGIRNEDLAKVAHANQHPNLLNNPVEMSVEKLVAMYNEIG